jgi:ketosteroid isomerase-like protein
VEAVESNLTTSRKRVLAGYTDDVVRLPPSGEVLSGKPAIRPTYDQLFSAFTINMSSEVVEARADGYLGFARGFTKGTLTPMREGPPVVVNDKFLALVRCDGGAWRVSHLMWSPVSSRE